MAKKRKVKDVYDPFSTLVIADEDILARKVGWVAGNHKGILCWRYYGGECGNLLEIQENVDKKRGKKGENFHESEWPPEKVEVIIRKL